MTKSARVSKIVVDWYIQHLDSDHGKARAVRARLKRCSSAIEALAVSETHELYARLKEKDHDPKPDQLALLAATFSQLKSIDGQRIATAFGTASKGGPRKLSELRFQSLIRVQTHRELITTLRRSMAVLRPDLSCNGWWLASDLYYWNDKVRTTWCLQYFGAAITKTKKGETKS